MKINNQLNVPQACEAMDKFKMQAASEVDINLTSPEAGSVGNQMVKNVCPMRTIRYERHNRIAMGHVQQIQYIASFTI